MRRLQLDISNLAKIAASSRLGHLVVTGLAFPLIYGGVEIIYSIGRFLIAYYLFFVAAVLEAITPTAPVTPRHDLALIDDNERRLGAARDAGIADAALIHAQQQQELAWWVNHRG